MLKPKSMSRIAIVGSKAVMKESISVLHKAALLHIDEFKASDAVPYGSMALEMGEPFQESARISASLVRLRSIGSHLPKVAENLLKKHVPGAEKEDENRLEKLDSEIKSRVDALKALDDEKGKIAAKIAELKPFAESPLTLENFGDYNSLALFAGYVSGRKKSRPDEIRSAARSKFPKSSMFSWEYEGKTVVALFVDIEKKEAARGFLSNYGYSEINIAPLKWLSGKASKIIFGLGRERAKLDEKKERLNAELDEISKEWLLFVKRKESGLLAESERAQAPLKFATTKNAFIVEGWIPKKQCPEVRNLLAQATKNRVYMEEEAPVRDAPVLLENPKPVQPFEFFMNLYALPKYIEIDPTFLMFLTFPIFFGMMLGDIGYGIISLAMFMFLKAKFKGGETKALLNIMIISALSSIIFGFVFGEFFGEEEVAGFVLPHLISRVHGIDEMLLITTAMGVVHINIGFVLGFINRLHHGFKHAFLEKGSWIVLEIGIALFAASYLNYISLSKYAGAAVSVLAIIMLFKAEGIKGIVEIPSLLSNSLSYSRIMAVGLASASLAIVVNGMAGELFHSGGLYIIPAIIILLLGHSINLALGMLGPFLHSLRLHYVEFFTKFFEGGGKRYMPFGGKYE